MGNWFRGFVAAVKNWLSPELPRKIVITLTPADCKVGTDYYSRSDCPLARAVRREVGSRRFVAVGVGAVRIDEHCYDIDGWFTYDDYLAVQAGETWTIILTRWS